MNEQGVLRHAQPVDAKLGQGPDAVTTAEGSRISEPASDRSSLSLRRRILDRFYSGCFIVAMAALVLMCVVILLQIGGRLIGVSVPAVPEVAAFSMAASSFLGLAHTFREGGHVRVSLLLSRLGSRRRLGFERFALTVALLLSLMFAIYLVDMAIESYRFNEASDGVIAIPLWIPQSLVAVGVIALAVAVADVMIDSWRGRMPGYVSKEEISH